MTGVAAKGKLTTHVLDTAHGIPAAGVMIDLLRADGEAFRNVRSAVTNEDGRLDSPLLEGHSLHHGQFELHFHVADYFRSLNVLLSQPAFLDIVPIRFGIADPAGHYHVPLLISPFGYSTYRGS
ncbi:MAG: hydroxyisourate hydrolase [Geminicoccaceae bacterium]